MEFTIQGLQTFDEAGPSKQVYVAVNKFDWDCLDSKHSKKIYHVFTLSYGGKSYIYTNMG